MPALLMHLRGAEAIRKSLPAPFATAVDHETWAYQLGSFLVDLPLFEGFWVKASLFLLRRPYPASRWGTMLHTRGAGSLVASILAEAKFEHRQDLLALVAGVLTHLALDRAMHPAIEEAVQLHLRPSETPSQLHEALENYQSLLWHRKNLGCDGLGTPLLKEGVTPSPGASSKMPLWLIQIFKRALVDVYGTGPTARDINRWVSGICGYRDLLSTPFAKLSIRSSEHLAEHRPWVTSVTLEPALEEGIDRAKVYLEAAQQAIDSPGAAFIEAIGDGPLV